MVNSHGKIALTSRSVAEVGGSDENSWGSTAVAAEKIVLEVANVDEEDEMLLVGLAMPESELLPLPVAEGVLLTACGRNNRE